MTEAPKKIAEAKWAAQVAITRDDFEEAAKGHNLEKSAKVSEAFHKAKTIEPSITFVQFAGWFAE
ncbi:MAG: hypothetical protein WA208_21840 [Thermoanaerobaculia bacterium]